MTDLAIQPVVLSRVAPFTAIPEHERGVLFARLPRRMHARGAMISCPDRAACRLHVLLSGSAKLVMGEPGGRQVTLTSLGPGDLFAEIASSAASTGIPCAVATQTCEVLHVSTNELESCIRAHPQAAVPLIADLTHKLHDAYARIASFAFDDVRVRVAHTLLDYAGSQRNANVAPVGSEELARIVGASREMVSRVLKSMETAGLLRRHRCKIGILDRDRLANECTRARAQASR